MYGITEEARFRTPNVAKEFDKFPQDKIYVWRNSSAFTVAKIYDWEDFSLCNKQFHNYNCVKTASDYIECNNYDDDFNDDDEKCFDECMEGSYRCDYDRNAYIIITINGIEYEIKERFTDLFTHNKKLIIVFS